MFGIGTQELLVIVLLGLMLFSPRELPKVIKGFARFWGSIRRTADEFRAAVMEDEELREPIDEIKQAYRGAKTEVRVAEDAARRELTKARMEVRRAERKLEEAAKGRDPGAEMGSRVAAEPEAPEPPKTDRSSGGDDDAANQGAA